MKCGTYGFDCGCFPVRTRRIFSGKSDVKKFSFLGRVWSSRRSFKNGGPRHEWLLLLASNLSSVEGRILAERNSSSDQGTVPWRWVHWVGKIFQLPIGSLIFPWILVFGKSSPGGKSNLRAIAQSSGREGF